MPPMPSKEKRWLLDGLPRHNRLWIKCYPAIDWVSRKVRRHTRMQRMWWRMVATWAPAQPPPLPKQPGPPSRDEVTMIYSLEIPARYVGQGLVHVQAPDDVYFGPWRS